MKGNGSFEINNSSEMGFSENIRELISAKVTVSKVKNSDGNMEARGAGRLVHQLSEASRREIEDLVGKLMTLHKKLQIDGDRIQLDIEEYADLSERVMQLTDIVADSVGKLPAPRVN